MGNKFKGLNFLIPSLSILCLCIRDFDAWSMLLYMIMVSISLPLCVCFDLAELFLVFIISNHFEI